jgi:23S rRNA pseudouridine2457 synthase
VLIAFNNPFGVICKFRPEPGRRTLADYINIANVYPAGRLDTVRRMTGRVGRAVAA